MTDDKHPALFPPPRVRHIRNPATYLDRTVQDWHWEQLPEFCTAIDVDLLGYCDVGYCRAPLYLLEASANPNKPLTVIRRLGERANVPARVILHDWHQPLHPEVIKRDLIWYRLRHYWRHHAGHTNEIDQMEKLL